MSPRQVHRLARSHRAGLRSGWDRDYAGPRDLSTTQGWHSSTGPESHLPMKRVLMREKRGSPRSLGQLSPPPCVQSPDKEAKPAFPDPMASQENEPDTGRSPTESWKQALQSGGGKGLDWEPGGLCTTASHHPPATILSPLGLSFLTCYVYFFN